VSQHREQLTAVHTETQAIHGNGTPEAFRDIGQGRDLPGHV
jgi:hypothetical protein